MSGANSRGARLGCSTALTVPGTTSLHADTTSRREPLKGYYLDIFPALHGCFRHRVGLGPSGGDWLCYVMHNYGVGDRLNQRKFVYIHCYAFAN